MTELREVTKFTPFTKSVDAYTGGVIGQNVFPTIDPEIYCDTDGKNWGMVYIKNVFGHTVIEGPIQWLTMEELEKENSGRLLTAFTNAMRLLEVE